MSSHLSGHDKAILEGIFADYLGVTRQDPAEPFPDGLHYLEKIAFQLPNSSTIRIYIGDFHWVHLTHMRTIKRQGNSLESLAQYIETLGLPK